MKNFPDFTLSFEFYPPRTNETLKEFKQHAQILADTHPDYFSVTFGAGGSNPAGTLETVTWLQTLQVPIAPHLTCIGASKSEMLELLATYQKMKITRLVVLRGDLPEHEIRHRDFQYASDLVSMIRQTTHNTFHIEVAAYPECHPESRDTARDMAAFRKKVEAGANSAITQYFYNPDAYFYFVDECARQNIFVPIIPGIMPITRFDSLVRFSDRCGAEIPRWLKRRLETCSDDRNATRALGLEVVSGLCQRLLAGGAPGLHFYTMNHANAVLELMQLLNLRAREAPGYFT